MRVDALICNILPGRIDQSCFARRRFFFVAHRREDRHARQLICEAGDQQSIADRCANAEINWLRQNRRIGAKDQHLVIVDMPMILGIFL